MAETQDMMASMLEFNGMEKGLDFGPFMTQVGWPRASSKEEVDSDASVRAIRGRLHSACTSARVWSRARRL